ncbi:MAG TPA: peptidylprolyl isomerase, partial [bacterium]|nr:peptidylprolyl isomerase [bacterium]
KTRAQKFDDIINDTYYQQKFKISDLGFIQSGIVDPELEKYVFDLKEGEWTNIIKTKLGFHIVYCYKVIEPQTPEFNDEIKAEIYNKIMEDAYKKNVEQAIENFRKNNKYQIYDDNLKYLIERLNKKN